MPNRHKESKYGDDGIQGWLAAMGESHLQVSEVATDAHSSITKYMSKL